MAKGQSLQDQLKALGLSRDKARAPEAKQSRKQGVGAAGASSARRSDSSGEMSLEKAWALKASEEKQRADTARRDKQAEDRRRRLLNNEIRQIVQAHRLNRDDAEASRNFMFRGRIRKIRVTPEQLKALNGGELGIVYLSGTYHLMANEAVEAVRKLSGEHVVDFGDEGGNDGDHPVPDDLVW